MNPSRAASHTQHDAAATLDLLAARIGALGPGRRLIAIAGAPGSGKSTLAEHLVERLDTSGSGPAAALPMDGYHLDDRVLIPRGMRSRKGAPDTFDVAGLCHMLARLRRNEEDEIAVPVFDRDVEIARAAARMIPRGTRIILVEGNYLLARQAPWSHLRPLFDLTVMISVPETILRERLIRRWRSHGRSPADIDAKLEDNDLPNGHLVRAGSFPPDITLADPTFAGEAT